MLSLIDSVTIVTAPSLVDILTASLVSPTSIDYNDKLSVLLTIDGIQRVNLGIELFTTAATRISLSKKIGDKVEKNVSNRQREFLLLQQLKAIKEELEDIAKGDDGALLSRIRSGGGKVDSEELDDSEDDLVELAKKIKEKNWSPEAKKVAQKEMKRLKKSPPQGAEGKTFDSVRLSYR